MAHATPRPTINQSKTAREILRLVEEWEAITDPAD